MSICCHGVDSLFSLCRLQTSELSAQFKGEKMKQEARNILQSSGFKSFPQQKKHEIRRGSGSVLHDRRVCGSTLGFLAMFSVDQLSSNE